MRSYLTTPIYGTKKEAFYAIKELKKISSYYYNFKIQKVSSGFRVKYKSTNKNDYLTIKQILYKLKRGYR